MFPSCNSEWTVCVVLLPENRFVEDLICDANQVMGVDPVDPKFRPASEFRGEGVCHFLEPPTEEQLIKREGYYEWWHLSWGSTTAV